MRLYAFLALFAGQQLVAGCATPRCPQNYVQHGMRCSRCPEGSKVRANACFGPDGGEVEPEDDGDAGIGEDEPDMDTQNDRESALDGSLDGRVESAADAGPVTDASRTECDANTSCSPGCESGFHVCAGSCVSDRATSTCGTRCTPCTATPANATASCIDGMCAFQCGDDFVESTGSCIRRNIYVSTSGSDTNDGSEAEPFRTYDRAMNGAVAGQVVHFAPGNYAEAFTRAVPDGVTLQRKTGQTQPVRFVGTGTQELLFAGGGSVRDVTIDGFGTPVSASIGRQAIERVAITNLFGPIRLSGSAITTMQDVTVSGAPAIGSDSRASLIKLTATAHLVMRGACRLIGMFSCDYPNDPPLSSAFFVSDSSVVELEATQVSGAFSNIALFFDATSTARLKDVAVSLETACYAAASAAIRGSATAFVDGGSYPSGFDAGVVQNTGRPTVEISGGTFSELSWYWRGTLKVRNATINRVVGISAPVDGVTLDFGTVTDPGGNTFPDGTTPNTSPFGASNQSVSGTLYVDVSGNRWIPSEQGASASGRYEVGTTSAKYTSTGRNFRVDTNVMLRF